MPPHIHVDATHLLFTMISIVAVFGTIKLMTLSLPGEWSHAFQTIGF